MSRTDKDMPDWVRIMHAAWDGETTWVEHDWTCEEHAGPVPTYWDRRARASHQCDVDTVEGRCARIHWVPRRWWSKSPSREWRRVCYYAPERAVVHNELRAAMREYNTDGNITTEPTIRPHRNAMWGGGWWD